MGCYTHGTTSLDPSFASMRINNTHNHYLQRYRLALPNHY